MKDSTQCRTQIAISALLSVHSGDLKGITFRESKQLTSQKASNPINDTLATIVIILQDNTFSLMWNDSYLVD